MTLKPRREALRHEIAEEIKAVARQQMRAKGTAGLSLRAIARQLEITAPAIYNYFPSLDDLITALIVDAFSDLAAAMRAAAEAAPAPPYAGRILSTTLAYREWALQHPVDFQLIYGNPIPGYQAPAEITGPLARKPFENLFITFMQAHAAGELVIPEEYRQVPDSVSAHIEAWKVRTGFQMPNPLFYLLIVGWSRIHGMVMLELFHHSQPTIGDGEAFYQHEVKALLARAGMRCE
jgi:AcrR family transcriptional regulator